MSCCRRTWDNAQPTLLAVFAGWDDSPTSVDASGSVGIYIRLVIADIGYTSPVEVNTGSNGFDISSVYGDLSNGDTICVQVSNTMDFAILDEDCRIIPTPGVTSTELIPDGMTFSFEGAPGDDTFLAPSSAATAVIMMLFHFYDANGNDGTITMTGQKQAFQAIDDSTAWTALFTTGSNVIVTAFGNVSVTRAFDPGFDINQSTYVLGTITDEMGISSVQDYYGITDAIFTSQSEYILTDTDVVITYLTTPAVIANTMDMAVLTGMLLNDITFEHEALAFTGTDVIIPNTVQKNNGEFGDNNNLIEVFINGVLAHPTTDYTVNRTTANAHKIVFGAAQASESIFVKWQLG